ncbi:uncharacterized protein C9orf85 homolog [Protopterus annectens]|uniref:uncharacterized protein C9orf85 homolog n=1 Tax=Protopterus annectens TaxID=7888 RepID=UPI001CFC158A|nr:uncharacterized protein C9orf85 homolog [Protopterus annectens]
MSSQRGNVSRTRSQKPQNTTVFKNDKYDATNTLKKLNTKVHDGVCQRCKDILKWKIKYNKYKLLTKPKTCVKYFQKTVKEAYHVLCKPCALKLGFCAKCGRSEQIISLNENNPEELLAEGRSNVGNTIKRNRKDEGDQYDSDSDEDENDKTEDSECEVKECKVHYSQKSNTPSPCNTSAQRPSKSQQRHAIPAEKNKVQELPDVAAVTLQSDTDLCKV